MRGLWRKEEWLLVARRRSLCRRSQGGRSTSMVTGESVLSLRRCSEVGWEVHRAREGGAQKQDGRCIGAG